MNFTGKSIGIVTYVIFAIAVVIHGYLLVGKIPISTFIIILLLLPVSLWASQQFNKVRKEHTDIIDNIKKEHEILSNKNNEIEQILDNIDDFAIYSFDKMTNNFYLSKGAEKIFGYTHQELITNPARLSESVYEEDKEKVVEKENQTLKGIPNTFEYRIVRSDGEIRWLIKREIPIKDQHGNIVKVRGNIVEITGIKGIETKFKQMAFSDPLTNTANRKLLDQHLRKSIARSRRHDHHLSIMFIDLDDFKKINDNLGHEIGDLLLKEMADRLNQNIREEDLIARFGGDEFVIVFEETNLEEMKEIAERILTSITMPYLLQENKVKMSPSIGISMYPQDGEDKETLIKNADKAMYFAKNNGKRGYQFYSPELIVEKKVNVLDKIKNHIQNFKS